MSEEQNNADNKITLVDDDGNETEYEILFTFDSEDYGKSYILLVPADSEPEEQVDVLAFSYDPNASGAEDGDIDLIEIDDDDEWQMVEDVLDTFLNDENMQWSIASSQLLTWKQPGPGQGFGCFFTSFWTISMSCGLFKNLAFSLMQREIMLK